MLPLLVVGGVISGIMSAVKGGSWLSDQINDSKGSASVGGKGGLTPLTDTQASAFAATLAAQGAGQNLPASTPTVAASSTAPAASLIPQVHAADYDTLARMKAGAVAYSHIGEHHGHHAGAVKPQDPNDSTTMAQS